MNISMIFNLEVIGFNIESCILAQNAGANRIELCDNPGEGGTTPSYGFIKAAREILEIDLYPIIRPRGGTGTTARRRAAGFSLEPRRLLDG